MTDDAILLQPATALAQLVRTREISSRELLAAAASRIDRLNPAVNAVVTLDLERGQQEAAAADDLTASREGDQLPPLHGLPMTVKDALETAGIRSTGGSPALSDHVPDRDAPAVGRLRSAGAVLFGKTHCPEWSGDVQTYSPLFGTTNNPWDTSRTPGGSSGGAAVAVALGLTSFETGTDIGGSIRIPAHFCGVYGHKPTFGIVPQLGYLDHAGGGLTDADINVVGPLARSVDDLELLLSVLSGPADMTSGWSLRLPAPERTAIGDLRIAAWLDDPGCAIDPAVASVLDDAVNTLTDAGATVDVEARPPLPFSSSVGLFSQLVSAAVAPSSGSPSIPHGDWLALDRERARVRRAWREWFTGYDVLLCPVSPTAAFHHNQEGGWLDRRTPIGGVDRPYFENIYWTGLIGVAYLPSTVAPVGRTADGLPVGVQVVGPEHGDLTTLAMARHLEETMGGFDPPPMAR